MRIIYDNLNEFAEIVIRCTDTVRKNKCQYCPLFDRCDVLDNENRRIMFGEIERSENGKGTDN